MSGADAYKAAGMDTLLLQAEQQGSSLLSSSQKQPEKASKSGADPAVNIKRAPVNLEPIILVPQAPSAVITKWNIKKLLEDGEYVTREQQKASGYKPEERISVMHQVPARILWGCLPQRPAYVKAYCRVAYFYACWRCA